MTSTKKNFNVILIEDDLQTVAYLRKLFDQTNEFNLIKVFQCAEDFVKYDDLEGFDILLLDLNLPYMSGLEAISDIKEKYEDIDIVILTVVDDSQKIFRAFRLGASGYLIKSESLESIHQELKSLAKGGAPLSSSIARLIIDYFKPSGEVKSLKGKEEVILKLFAEGLSYIEASEALGVSIDVIRYYVKKIYQKLHVSNKLDALKKYNQFLSNKNQE